MPSTTVLLSVFPQYNLKVIVPEKTHDFFLDSDSELSEWSEAIKSAIPAKLNTAHVKQSCTNLTKIETNPFLTPENSLPLSIRDLSRSRELDSSLSVDYNIRDAISHLFSSSVLPTEPWFYRGMTREQAEIALICVNSITHLPEGTFLVRESSVVETFAISVCSQKRVVHHQLSLSPLGIFELNGRPCGRFKVSYYH